MLIDYKEALRLLQLSAPPKDEAAKRELLLVLKVMVQQYFSRYNATDQIHGDSMVTQVVGSVNPHAAYWDNSDLAMDVSTLIVKITQQYLPGFSSFRLEDCAAIINFHMRDDAVVRLEVNAQALQRFIRPYS